MFYITFLFIFMKHTDATYFAVKSLEHIVNYIGPLHTLEKGLSTFYSSYSIFESKQPRNQNFASLESRSSGNAASLVFANDPS